MTDTIKVRTATTRTIEIKRAVLVGIILDALKQKGVTTENSNIVFLGQDGEVLDLRFCTVEQHDLVKIDELP